MPRAQARERARVSSVQHRVWVALHYLGGGDGSFAMQGPTSSCSARCRASPCFLPSRAVSIACWQNSAPRDSQNEFYGRFAGIAGSIRFNVRELHHFGRFFGFVGEELTEAVAPNSASRAFILGSARAALISLLSLSTISTGVFFGAPTPGQKLDS